MAFGIRAPILVRLLVKADNIRSESECHFPLFSKILVFLFNISKNHHPVAINEKLDFFSQSACSKITTDGCKNVTSLTKAVPGSKVDACGVSCCYTDKCNTKDLVVLSKPTAKSVAPFSEVSLIINLLVFLLSAGIAVTAIQWKEASPKGRHFGFLQGRDNNSGFGVLTLSNYLSL